jgi:hypothetical protein
MDKIINVTDKKIAIETTTGIREYEPVGKKIILRKKETEVDYNGIKLVQTDYDLLGNLPKEPERLYIVTNYIYDNTDRKDFITPDKETAFLDANGNPKHYTRFKTRGITQE